MNLEHGDLDDLKIFFESHKGRLKVSFDTLLEVINDWKIWRLCDKTVVAIILTKDGAGHIANCGQNVGIRRMKWALDELGISKTTVGQEFKKGHALAKRLGFHVEMTEKGVTHYVRIPNKPQ